MYQADLKHPSPCLEDKLHQLYNLHRDKKIDLSFRLPYLDLLKAFGNPHLSLPSIIHVAGTNGKGSIIAIIRSILEADGKQAHAYTSPHLLRFNERISLAGREIDDVLLEELIDEALMFNQGSEVTFFEITTAMAFAAFSRVKADFCLLEVGLGGRLDCTNVIENPAVTVINIIGYDHQDMLGETLVEIAAEKAGIMKPGVPCVIGPQQSEEAMAVFERRAEELGAELYRFGEEWTIEPHLQGMAFTFEGETSLHPLPNLIGRHQIMNAGVALATLKAAQIRLQNPVSPNIGLYKIKWRGRLEQIVSGPIVETMPKGWELWYDGGHNADAGQVLAAQAKIWQEQDGKPLYLVVGMRGDKDLDGFLEPLLPLVQSLISVPIPHIDILYNLKSFEEARVRLKAQAELYDAPSVMEAVSYLCQGKKPGRILVCGSVYLAGELLA